jgi:hypothetical protein
VLAEYGVVCPVDLIVNLGVVSRSLYHPMRMLFIRPQPRLRSTRVAKIMFWADPWIQGQCVATIAPALLKLVPPGLVRTRTVLQGRANNSWVLDIVGTLTIDVLF